MLQLIRKKESEAMTQQTWEKCNWNSNNQIVVAFNAQEQTCIYARNNMYPRNI
jgi:hypothetical protein